MGFNDRYRLSAHAIVVDRESRVLLLQASYGSQRWGLPGGNIEPGENLSETLQREAVEELGTTIDIDQLIGVYAQPEFEAHVAIFRGSLPADTDISLSDEHVDAQWVSKADLDDYTSTAAAAEMLRTLLTHTSPTTFGSMPQPADQ